MSCNKSEIGPQNVKDDALFEIESAGSLLIACEGNFSQANPSLSQYDIQSMSVNNNVYQSINGMGLGDVFQSICEIDESLYFIINNSSKIIKVDKATLVSQDEIILSGRSPRYMVSANNNQSFISNLVLSPDGAPVYIDVMDNQNNEIIDSINVGEWTEEMLVLEDVLYACVMGGSEVVAINVNSHEIIETYMVGKEPISIVKDKDDSIWVLCTGGFDEELPSLWKIDVLNDTITELSFDTIESYPNSLTINGSKDSLYFLNDGVYKMSIDSDSITDELFISQGAGSFYALGVDPMTNEVYASDPNGFQGTGFILRYSANGSLINEFEVGVIPSYFYFN
ncbi:MAG: hypothetical protein ACI8XB_001390 [Patiriisocius sp.]|jgi:hypothetical protein